MAGFGNMVLAHPFNKYHSLEEYCKTTQNNFTETLKNLFRKGISGIEVYSGRHSLEQISLLESESQKNKCIMTCGSDFHKYEDLDRFVNNLNQYIGLRRNKSLIECLGVLK